MSARRPCARGGALPAAGGGGTLSDMASRSHKNLRPVHCPESHFVYFVEGKPKGCVSPTRTS